jgi:hypothetical protein
MENKQVYQKKQNNVHMEEKKYVPKGTYQKKQYGEKKKY